MIRRYIRPKALNSNPREVSQCIHLPSNSLTSHSPNCIKCDIHQSPFNLPHHLGQVCLVNSYKKGQTGGVGVQVPFLPVEKEGQQQLLCTAMLQSSSGVAAPWAGNSFLSAILIHIQLNMTVSLTTLFLINLLQQSYCYHSG